MHSWMWPNEVIFQHSPVCGPHTSSISVAVLGPHWSRIINSRYVNVSAYLSMLCVCVCVCIYIYICLCEGHSIKKWILSKMLTIGNIVYSCIYFKEIKSCVLSCTRRLSAWPSLLTAVARTFSLLKSRWWTDILTKSCSGQPVFCPFL